MFSNKLKGKIKDLPFNERALLFGELSQIAYYSETDVKKLARKLGFTTVEFYSIEGADSYRFMNKNDLVVACRGTQPKEYNDIKADAKTWPVVAETAGRVHSGFKEEVDKLWPNIKEDLIREGKDRDVWITGHSLGGAMATIITSRCKGDTGCPNPEELHTFGSPKVGWKSYTNYHNFVHYRWVNNADIVARIPFWWMGYRHHGRCMYFNHYGNLRNIHGWQRVKDKWRGIFKGLKNFKFDPISDHNPIQYVQHLKNLADGKEVEQPEVISHFYPMSYMR